ncbi:MAG: hypothetical protein ACWA5K_09000 [bacterium]
MKKTTIAFIVFAAVLSHSALAEVITVPIGQQGTAKQAIAKPSTGQSKEQVLEKFGEPASRSASVGEPPISSWDYGSYVVYFEYDHVIHAVLKPDPINH